MLFRSADTGGTLTVTRLGKRLTIDAAVKELPIGDRAELLRWRAAVGKVLGEVLG